MCEWLPKNTASLLLPVPILQQLLHDEHDEQELPDVRDLDCMKFGHRKEQKMRVAFITGKSNTLVILL
jgi:hypothetical protein